MGKRRTIPACGFHSLCDLCELCDLGGSCFSSSWFRALGARGRNHKDHEDTKKRFSFLVDSGLCELCDLCGSCFSSSGCRVFVARRGNHKGHEDHKVGTTKTTKITKNARLIVDARATDCASGARLPDVRGREAGGRDHACGGSRRRSPILRGWFFSSL